MTWLKWDKGKQCSSDQTSDQGVNLHTNKIKMKKYTRHSLNEKWTLLIKKDGIVQYTKKGVVLSCLNGQESSSLL